MGFTTSSVQEELHDSNRPLCLLALTISYSNRAHHIISFNLNSTEISYNYKDPTTLNTRLEECPHYNSIEQINKLKQNPVLISKGAYFPSRTGTSRCDPFCPEPWSTCEGLIRGGTPASRSRTSTIALSACHPRDHR